ncbi:MAG TPA: YdeI/OmpD-associated family protein [Candidatus Limnocylindria bacterium]|nr:YdeI/OmpD-associated family protein [Candidatus Limnocylindria bacterium]
MKYRTTILATGPNTTGIPVPDEVLAALDAGKRPAVTVRLGSHAYRSTVASMNGAPMISLSAENRGRAGLSAGDSVDVELELDTAPRDVEVPEELATALATSPEARRTWESLSYSNRRWHVESIQGAKSDETRQRRIAKSVAALAAGRPR